MSKECTVRTGKLRPRRLLMIRMARITDHLVKERTSRAMTTVNVVYNQYPIPLYCYAIKYFNPKSSGPYLSS